MPWLEHPHRRALPPTVDALRWQTRVTIQRMATAMGLCRSRALMASSRPCHPVGPTRVSAPHRHRGASPPTGASPGSVTCALRRWRLSSCASHPHTGGDARPRPRVRLRRQGLDSIRAPPSVRHILDRAGTDRDTPHTRQRIVAVLRGRPPTRGTPGSPAPRGGSLRGSPPSPCAPPAPREPVGPSA